MFKYFWGTRSCARDKKSDCTVEDFVDVGGSVNSRDLNNYTDVNVLYVFRIKGTNYYKYGKTNNIHRRFGEHKLKFKEYGGFDIESVKFWKISTYDQLSDVEKKFGALLRQRNLLRPGVIKKTGGGFLKEIFEVACVDPILEVIDSYVSACVETSELGLKLELAREESNKCRLEIQRDQIRITKEREEQRTLTLHIQLLKLKLGRGSGSAGN